MLLRLALESWLPALDGELLRFARVLLAAVEVNDDVVADVVDHAVNRGGGSKLLERVLLLLLLLLEVVVVSEKVEEEKEDPEPSGCERAEIALIFDRDNLCAISCSN